MKRRFRFPRLHWFAWLGLLASTVVMTILVVPGLPSDYRMVDLPEYPKPKIAFPRVIDKVVNGRSVTGGRPELVREFEHGWPLTFMRRAYGYSSNRTFLNWAIIPPSNRVPLGGMELWGHEVSWTAPIAWERHGADLQEFYVWPAVLDALVMISVVLATTAACQSWVQKRGAVWRWRLIDIVAAFTMVAVLLGVWRYHASAHDMDASVYPYPDRTSKFQGPWRYGGPVWLARLIGGREPLDSLDRLTSFTMGRVQYGQPVETETTWQDIGKLTALEKLTINANQPSVEEFETIVQLPRLRELTWRQIPHEALDWLPRLRQVKRIALVNCDAPKEKIDAIRATMTGVDIKTEWRY